MAKAKGGLFADEAEWQRFRETERKLNALSQEVTNRFMEQEAAEKEKRQQRLEEVQKAIDAGELPPEQEPEPPKGYPDSLRASRQRIETARQDLRQSEKQWLTAEAVRLEKKARKKEAALMKQASAAVETLAKLGTEFAAVLEDLGRVRGTVAPGNKRTYPGEPDPVVLVDAVTNGKSLVDFERPTTERHITRTG